MSHFSRLISSLKGSLSRFDADRSGTTLTELLITLPVFIIIFAGVVRLGSLQNKSIVVEGTAYQKTFNKALEIQGLDVAEGLSGLLQGSGSALHMSPPAAAADAIVQLETYEPRQRGLVKGAIKLAEHTTYSFDGLVLSGHFGESRSRVRPLSLMGVGFLGVNNAVTANPEDILGQSYLGRDLLYDGPNADNFDGVASGNALHMLYSMVNGLISMTGARSALAANLRYGTVTGVHRDQLDFGDGPTDFESHYTVSVPTYLGSDPWFDQMRAMVITRFTMANPNYAIYNKTLGFHGQANFEASSGPLEVPELDEVTLTMPLDYNADTLPD
jgi:hypothetical protein